MLGQAKIFFLKYGHDTIWAMAFFIFAGLAVWLTSRISHSTSPDQKIAEQLFRIYRNVNDPNCTQCTIDQATISYKMRADNKADVHFKFQQTAETKNQTISIFANNFFSKEPCDPKEQLEITNKAEGTLISFTVVPFNASNESKKIDIKCTLNVVYSVFAFTKLEMAFTYWKPTEPEQPHSKQVSTDNVAKVLNLGNISAEAMESESEKSEPAPATEASLNTKKAQKQYNFSVIKVGTPDVHDTLAEPPVLVGNTDLSPGDTLRALWNSEKLESHKNWFLLGVGLASAFAAGAFIEIFRPYIDLLRKKKKLKGTSV
jgi:hypothetical protein